MSANLFRKREDLLKDVETFQGEIGLALKHLDKGRVEEVDRVLMRCDAQLEHLKDLVKRCSSNNV